MLKLAVLVLLCLRSTASSARTYTSDHEPSKARSILAARSRKQASTVASSKFAKRLLLTPSSSELVQNVSYTYYGTFREEFEYFANTALVDHNLQSVEGKCSIDPSLHPAVAQCAGIHQLCCFNASEVQVQ